MCNDGHKLPCNCEEKWNCLCLVNYVVWIINSHLVYIETMIIIFHRVSGDVEWIGLNTCLKL